MYVYVVIMMVGNGGNMESLLSPIGIDLGVEECMVGVHWIVCII